MQTDIVRDMYPEEQRQVGQRIHEIMAAVQNQDLELLESYHLFGPKFTKFSRPMDRQDAESTRRRERESIAGPKAITASASDLKVDVFGRVAIATFLYRLEVTSHADEQSARSVRCTMVLVKDGADWLITHEHMSAFTSDPS